MSGEKASFGTEKERSIIVFLAFRYVLRDASSEKIGLGVFC